MDLPFLKEQQTSSNANKKSKTGASRILQNIL